MVISVSPVSGSIEYTAPVEAWSSAHRLSPSLTRPLGRKSRSNAAMMPGAKVGAGVVAGVGVEVGANVEVGPGVGARLAGVSLAGADVGALGGVPVEAEHAATSRATTHAETTEPLTVAMYDC